MKRLGLAALAVLAGLAAVASARPAPPPAADISDAITEIDLERARKLLDVASGDATALALARARLAVYVGDCDAAAAQLSAPTLGESKEGATLAALAKSCARATAAGFVVDDAARGISLRFQDDADRVLAPFLLRIAARARDSVAEDVGVELLRPLRIEVVRDLFSLSAVSGLPLKAAETTGTLAVARWGRVIFLSPRATPLGFPWQDTLAHEITHLIVTRASRDRAPLWLQEGVAKREETRWRPARPFDDPNWADTTARSALLAGRGVGLDQLGPSIAMLPTPEAATTAFAEVSSFVKFWLGEVGPSALELLLLDLRATGADSPDPALESVSGYSLAEWNVLWRANLREQPPRDPREEALRPPPLKDGLAFARGSRLGDLLLERGHTEAARHEYRAALDAAPAEPSIRWRLARASLLLDDQPGFRAALGDRDKLRAADGGWLALSSRALREDGHAAEAADASEHALALEPLLEDVACDGAVRAPGGTAPLPADPDRRALCQSVRAP
ncbi:MAG TPA: hypothetical protein VMI54_11475 [Polyangiaceae bacterium]|nr:hypothetical protein [Polyangiaceae bacterium]